MIELDKEEQIKEKLTCWVTGGFVEGLSTNKNIWPATWYVQLKDGKRTIIKATGKFRKFDMQMTRFFHIEKIVRFKFAVASFFRFLKTPLDDTVQ